MRGVAPLHPYHFVIARSVIERVAPLREVVHDIVLVEVRDPRSVVPRHHQFVVGRHFQKLLL